METTFEDILKQYEPMLHKIIRQLHIYTNDEDWLQIAKIALWEAWNRYESGKGLFLNYAYSYVRGYLLLELTKRAKIKEDYTDTFTTSIVLPDYQTNVLALECLNHLNENERRWFIHTVFYDLSITDIAKKYDVSPSTVKYWRKCARDKLSIFLKNC